MSDQMAEALRTSAIIYSVPLSAAFLCPPHFISARHQTNAALGITGTKEKEKAKERVQPVLDYEQRTPNPEPRNPETSKPRTPGNIPSSGVSNFQEGLLHYSSISNKLYENKADKIV